jgi:hypothetical protein
MVKLFATAAAILLTVLDFSSFPPARIQGTYKHIYGKTDKSPYQILEIHYVNPSKILFYLEAGRGAPSYNSGALYGELTFNKKTGHYQYIPKDISEDCKLEFIIGSNKVIVKTVAGDCGFGFGVYADDTYTLTDKSNPQYFITRTDKKVFFDKTSPDALRDY